MSERVTLELPSELAERARVVATRTERPFEAVLVEWIQRGGAQPTVDALPDDEVLRLCEDEWESDRQEELSELLERRQEGVLSETDLRQLEELMQSYRLGLVRKAQALQVAVRRGLRPRLN